jgi:methanogenic corrinoid protein MtbC1
LLPGGESFLAVRSNWKDMQPSPETVVARILAATEAYDISACEQLISSALATPDPLVCIRDVVAPVLRETGIRWHAGKLSVAQEHMISGVVRRQLSHALDRYLLNVRGLAILFATLTGERHEMGGLMAAVLAASRGFRCIYLGPDLPAAEIARFCANHPVAVVALSLVVQPDVIDALAQLAHLRAHVAGSIEIWVAGQAATMLTEQEIPAGVTPIADLQAYLGRLAELQARLAAIP